MVWVGRELREHRIPTLAWAGTPSAGRGDTREVTQQRGDVLALLSCRKTIWVSHGALTYGKCLKFECFRIKITAEQGWVTAGGSICGRIMQGIVSQQNGCAGREGHVKA